ncbi:MAG: hypothetical protein AAF270_15235 [Pseudomonadota bacterium]
MSYNWCFQSFDAREFELAARNSRPEIVNSVLREMMEPPGHSARDVEQFERIGEFIIEHGLTYMGLNKADAEVLDRFVFDAFHVLAE